MDTHPEAVKNVQLARRGRVIVVAGPDGTGKTSLTDALVGRLRTQARVRRFHHRLRALPSSETSRKATTSPQAQRPYGCWLSLLKVLYLFVDQLLGWATNVRPHVSQGGWVVVERGWWDLRVDPLRYRLRNVGWLVTWLGRRLPHADITVILDAPPSLIQARKAELSLTELERQLRAWRALASNLPGTVVIDASRSQEAVLEAVLVACGDTAGAG